MICKRCEKSRIQLDGTLAVEEAERAIRAWCKKHIGEELPVTCSKDPGMIELWDDRTFNPRTSLLKPMDIFPTDRRFLGQLNDRLVLAYANAEGHIYVPEMILIVGYFDIIDVKTVRMLIKARAEYGTVTCAVYLDGKKKLCNSVVERIEVLQEFQCVDEVIAIVPGDEDRLMATCDGYIQWEASE